MLRFKTRTGVAAIREDVIRANPGLPKAGFEMYSSAKQKAYADLEATTSLKVTLPGTDPDRQNRGHLVANRRIERLLSCSRGVSLD